MDKHISMMQHLHLLPGTHAVHARTSSIVQHGCRLLQRVGCASAVHDTTLQDAANRKQMISWRPRYVKDLLLILDGSARYGTIAAEDDGNLQCFAPVAGTLPNALPEAAVLCCHLTCDVVHGRPQPVLLAYDMHTPASLAARRPMPERYQDMLRLRDAVEGIVVGAAPVRVQWLGPVESYDKLCALELPHERGGIVALDGEAYYEYVRG